MKNLVVVFKSISVFLACVMSAVVAYNYRDMLCGIEHAGYSAPISVAVLSAAPFVLGIVICVVAVIAIGRKER